MYRVIRLIFLSNISFASLFGQIWNKNNPKKKKRVAAHRFLFYLGFCKFCKFLQTSSCRVREEKKKITCASLIIILVSLFFVSLSRCCFFALSSNARSWEDKGKRNEMIFWTMGARDSLWDVVVKWDDICFKHILPRLDLNDVKFLYGVNTETRALIKRSTRANDLEREV